MPTLLQKYQRDQFDVQVGQSGFTLPNLTNEVYCGSCKSVPSDKQYLYYPTSLLWSSIYTTIP